MVVVALVGLLAAPGAFAATVTLDFDDVPNGIQVSQVDDINFVPPARVFNPVQVSTFSGSQALKVSGVCATPDCPNGAYRMLIRFGQPLPLLPNAMLWRRAERVSMRIGADSLNTVCIPENTSCAVYARLYGYDENGTPVVASSDVFLLDTLSTNGTLRTPITHPIEISDPFARIVSASLVYGKETFLHDAIPPLPGEPQIDHLEVTFPETLPPPPTPPAPPTVQIVAPVNGSQRTYPYQTRLRGSIAVPGGLSTFCYRLNAPPVARQSECRNNTDLRPDSTFDIGVADSALAAGANSLSVTVFDLWGQSATSTVTFVTRPPPPPQVKISAPAADAWVSATQATPVSGTVATLGSLQGLCVLVDAAAVPAPSGCLADLGAIQGSNPTLQPLLFRKPVAAQRFSPGEHTISVFAVDRWDQLGRADVVVNSATNFRVVAMEVTQGIQTEDLPLNVNGTASYNGVVKLRQGVPTVVRVFANTPNPGSYAGASMLLSGFVPHPRLGERQLGSLLPDSKPSSLTSGPLAVPLKMRASPNGGFVFTLPRDWTLTNGLRLRAALIIPLTLRECDGCLGDNSFSVTGINFAAPRQLTISPMALVYTDSTGATRSPPPPEEVFARLKDVAPMPLASWTVLPYVATIDVSDVVNPATGGCVMFTATCQDAVFGRVTQMEGAGNPGLTIGVGPIDVGVEYPTIVGNPPHAEPIAIADTRRPLQAVAHEFFHELSYYHAGPNCPRVNMWIWWPPDDKGYIHGVGLDRRQSRDAAGVWNGQYRILMPGSQGLPGGLDQYYDLMSYCVNTNDPLELDTWISVENWNKFDDLFPNGLWPSSFFQGDIVPPAGSAASRQRFDSVEVAGGTLLASAIMDETGRVPTLHVTRGGRTMAKPPDARTNSDFAFVVRDARGAVLARVPPLIERINGNSAGGTVVIGAVPARNVASIELEHQGQTIGAALRSRAAPKLTLTAPSTRVSVAPGGSVQLRWAASDADDKGLDVRIEYAPGPDQPFRPVWAGPNRGRARVAASTLEPSANGRLRLVASDGFNEVSVVSKPIVVLAGPPTLKILTPLPRTSFPRSAPVRLEAVAFGNDRTAMRGAKLTWTVDGRRAGTGRVVELRYLKPGRHEATVAARDGSLTSTRRVVFTVRPAKSR